ncbi:sugar transporter [Sphingobium sp.]|uniref:sugar transporter n=1 Tax=Sphingobium sp. TaxID=1912891 RepID=UPI0035C6FDE5
MTAPRSVSAIGIILLFWNMIGVAAFIMQYSADLNQLAKTDAYTARIFAQMPGWAWTAYGVAVGAGTLGAILLLFRKAAAAPVFLLSVIAVIAQFGYSFLGTDLLAVKGATAAIFPAVILVIAVFQWRYARSLTARGMLR